MHGAEIAHLVEGEHQLHVAVLHGVIAPADPAVTCKKFSVVRGVPNCVNRSGKLGPAPMNKQSGVGFMLVSVW